MRQIVLSAILICTILDAIAGDPVDKGADDLLRNSTMSQPFTILDQLLLSLDRKAREAAKHFRPTKNDFQLGKNWLGQAFSFVKYDATNKRTHVQFSVVVSSIADPWRDVCVKWLKDTVTFGLGLPYHEEWKQQEYRLTALAFFSEFLGPRLASNQAQLTNYKSFSDSIVVELQFPVESGDRARPLKFLRQCFWDNKTGKISFAEYKY